jgi:hypothetical protein
VEEKPVKLLDTADCRKRATPGVFGFRLFSISGLVNLVPANVRQSWNTPGSTNWIVRCSNKTQDEGGLLCKNMRHCLILFFFNDFYSLCVFLDSLLVLLPCITCMSSISCIAYMHVDSDSAPDSDIEN